jgi:dTDP-4-dehydrorhamnose reductase
LTLLITGGDGTLGRELVKLYPESVHPSHLQLDITNKKTVDAFWRKSKLDMVIHCAALTGVRECEDNKGAAWKVNVEGTENLIQSAEALSKDCYFVYISTACVFYGDRGDYGESDPPYPKNYYSLTKLMGEAAVRHSRLKRWLILRTNFVGREKWHYPKAFVDRYGTYLFADDVAQAIRGVTSNGMTGILHVAGKRKLSMFELARMTTPEVEPMTLGNYKGPPLTVDMTLRSERIPSFEITPQVSPTQ